MDKRLSATEDLMMRAIYDATTNTDEHVSVPELMLFLKDNYDKDYARTTVVTFLQRMAAKGFVTTYRKGRLSYVVPLVKKEDYRKTLLQELLQNWFDGEREKLIEEL